MSETIVRYLLSELKIVRVICKSCNAILEVEVESLRDVLNLDRRTNTFHCKLCNAELFSSAYSSDLLTAFARTLSEFDKITEKLEIGLVFPAND